MSRSSSWSNIIRKRESRDSVPSLAEDEASGQSLDVPKLLAPLVNRRDSSFTLTARIIQVNRDVLLRQNVSLLDLINEFWPGAQHTDNISAAFWMLEDANSCKFFLQRTKLAILVRTDFVKAVIEPTRVTFVNSNSNTFNLFLEEFLSNAKWSQWNDASADPTTFGNFVLECILCAEVTLQHTRFMLIKPVANDIIWNLRTSDFNAVQELYPLKMILKPFVDRLRHMVKSLRQVLDMDEDIENSFAFHSKTRYCAKERCLPHPHRHACSETFVGTGLETAALNWCTLAQDIMAEAAKMCSNIDEHLMYLEASMDFTRNRYIRIDLGTLVIQTSLAVGALISGLFGMNLDTDGLYESPGSFHWVAMSTLVFVVVMIWAIRKKLIRLHYHYLRHAERYGNNRFFREINDDSYVLALADALPESSQSQATLRQQVLREELSILALPAGQSSPWRCTGQNIPLPSSPKF